MSFDFTVEKNQLVNYSIETLESKVITYNIML